MLNDSNISQTSDLISAVWTKSGYLKGVDRNILRFYVAHPLSSAVGEIGFVGPTSDGFYQRLQDGLTKLPSLHHAQIVQERRPTKSESKDLLFPAVGLKTTLYVIESELKKDQSGIHQLLLDLGCSIRPGERTDYLNLLKTLLGQANENDDFLLPDVIWEEEHIKSGRSFVKLASLTDQPLGTWNNCLGELFESPEEFVCSLKISVPDKARSRKSLETKRRVSHALSARKAHELSDLDSSSSLSASEEILIRVTQGKECLMSMSLAILVSGKDLELVQNRLQTLVSAATGSSGAGFYIEGIGNLPVLRSHLPGAPLLMSRELPILSGNLNHLIPIFMDYSRHQEPSSLKLVSRGGELCHLNFFAESNLSFNSFIAGATGSGKSFLMNSILAAFRQDHPNSNVMIFDVGGSYRKLVSKLGGTSLQLDANSTRSLIAACFSRLSTSPNGFCKTLLETICGSGTHITHSHRVAIEDLLLSCSGQPFSLTAISQTADTRQEMAYRDIALWLRPYLGWDLLKSEHGLDAILDANVQAFDFKNLDGDPLLQRLAILILTNGIWERLKKSSSEPTMIVFDEVWRFFSQASSYLEEMYRTLRKYRAGITSLTQNLGDYGNDAFADLVITCSYNKILLQGAANSSLLETSFDLSESDKARILSVSSQKNEYSEFWFGTSNFSQILRLYPSASLFQLANSENIQKENNLCG